MCSKDRVSFSPSFRCTMVNATLSPLLCLLHPCSLSTYRLWVISQGRPYLPPFPISISLPVFRVTEFWVKMCLRVQKWRKNTCETTKTVSNTNNLSATLVNEVIRFVGISLPVESCHDFIIWGNHEEDELQYQDPMELKWAYSLRLCIPLFYLACTRSLWLLDNDMTTFAFDKFIVDLLCTLIPRPS